MRILVADNELDERINLTKLISSLGHTPVEAVSASEIIESFRQKPPDLALIDFVLAGKSGVDVVRQVRALGGVAAWNPLILMSKSAQSMDELIDGMEAGADDYFIKPIDPIILQYKIGSALRNQDLKQQVFSVAHDLVVANRALEGMITKDSLTGLENSNSFEQALERSWFEARKAKSNLILLLVDIDSFQLYNSEYGADKGDIVLVKVAKAIKRLTKDTNYHLARLRGATFAILMPDIDYTCAEQFAESIRTTIDKLAIQHIKSVCSKHITVSIGGVISSDNIKTPRDLLDSADYALYSAKHKGRNKVSFIPQELVE